MFGCDNHTQIAPMWNPDLIIHVIFNEFGQNIDINNNTAKCFFLFFFWIFFWSIFRQFFRFSMRKQISFYTIFLFYFLQGGRIIRGKYYLNVKLPRCVIHVDLHLFCSSTLNGLTFKSHYLISLLFNSVKINI